MAGRLASSAQNVMRRPGKGARVPGPFQGCRLKMLRVPGGRRRWTSRVIDDETGLLIEKGPSARLART